MKINTALFFIVLCIGLQFSISIIPAPAQAQNNRPSWFKAAYNSIPTMMPVTLTVAAIMLASLAFTYKKDAFLSRADDVLIKQKEPWLSNLFNKNQKQDLNSISLWDFLDGLQKQNTAPQDPAFNEALND